MGVPIDGLPVVGITYMSDQGNLCHDLLGHRPPTKEPSANNNTAVLCGARLKVSGFESQFSDPFPTDVTNLQVQQYTPYYILQLLGGMLFMDKSIEQISVMYLQFLNPISNDKKYSWGSAALCWLYRHLCKALEKKASQIGGALLLVQFWAYAKFPHICQMMRHPHQALPQVHLLLNMQLFYTYCLHTHYFFAWGLCK